MIHILVEYMVACVYLRILKYPNMFADIVAVCRAVLWIRNYFFPDPDPTLTLIPVPACL
jgi:hypothetical protein